MSQSVAIVPAAGRAERFGGAKLLADVGGMTMLDRTVRCLLDGGVDQIVVVLPPEGRFETVAVLNDPQVKTVTNPDPSRGMFSSIQVGMEAADGNPVLVMPGDMPFVSASTVIAVLAAFARTGNLVIPKHDGHRGHPIALPEQLKAHILKMSSTGNLSAALKLSGVTRVELEVQDVGILRDVDVRGDLS